MYTNLEWRYNTLVDTKAWKDLSEKFSLSTEIYLCSHGGNTAITRHLGTDLMRLMNNDKKFLSPDSDTVAIWHGDYDYKTWLSDWLTSQIKDHKNHFALVIGFSASGNSPDVNEALKWASNHNIDNFLITGNFEGKPAKNTIDINTSHYYKYEILIIMLMYRLYEEAGYTIPKLKTRQ